jgi:hypothetical protein
MKVIAEAEDYPLRLVSRAELGVVEQDRFAAIRLPLSAQNVLATCRPYEGCRDVKIRGR